MAKLAADIMDGSTLALRAQLAAMQPSAVFTSAEAATYARVGGSTWERWRMTDRKLLPPAIRLSARRLGYRKSDVDAWLDARLERNAA
jgi:predicted DNA-binding transcriptional regulator AlpA